MSKIKIVLTLIFVILLTTFNFSLAQTGTYIAQEVPSQEVLKTEDSTNTQLIPPIILYDITIIQLKKKSKAVLTKPTEEGANKTIQASWIIQQDTINITYKEASKRMTLSLKLVKTDNGVYLKLANGAGYYLKQ